jgi:hypothetical protein
MDQDPGGRLIKVQPDPDPQHGVHLIITQVIQFMERKICPNLVRWFVRLMAREQQEVSGEEDQDAHLIPVSISTLLGLTRLAKVGKR